MKRLILIASLVLMVAATQYQTYNAWPKQAAFHRAVRRYDYAWLNAGRGFGKTTAGAIQSVMESIQYQPASRGVIVAPTYDMLYDASLAELFRWLPRQFIAEHHKQRKHIILTNGSEIAYRSGDDPETLRGPNRSWAWLDEPRNYKTPETFETVTGQLRPTIKLWLTSTPLGIYHWMYKKFVEDPLPSSKLINAKTSENPLNIAYEARMRAQYSDHDAQQELDADFVGAAGTIYNNFSLDDNVVEVEPDPTLPILWGVDDGYAFGSGPGTLSYHPRVFLIAQVTPLGGLNVFYERYVTSEADYNLSIDALIGNPEKGIDGLDYPRPAVAYVDSSAAMLRGALTLRGIPTAGGTHVVTEGIKNLRRMVCDGNGVRLLKIHPRCKNLIKEMQSYHTDDAVGVAVDGEKKPAKMDDHGPDVLRYLTWHLRYGA